MTTAEEVLPEGVVKIGGRYHRTCEKCGVQKAQQLFLRNKSPTDRSFTNVCISCHTEVTDAALEEKLLEREVDKAAVVRANHQVKDRVAKRKQAAVGRAKKKLADKRAMVKAAQAVNAADRELASRALARRKLLYFIQKFKPDYEPGWVHEDICDRLERFFRAVENKESPRLILAMPPRHGKEIAHSTPVMIPSGWTTHGELRPGDLVFSPTGEQLVVEAIAEDEHEDDYVVTTSQGESIRCHANHEWTVYDRSPGVWRTVDTSYLASQKIHSGAKGGQGGRYRFHLPPVAPLELRPVNLPLDPYFLGAWLGDGTRTTTDITYHPDDYEVVAEILSRGFVPGAHYIHPDTGVHRMSFPHQDILRTLKELGCAPDKHIPPMYLRASIDQRLDVLAGLIDTDGHVERVTGRVRIATCDKILADSILELANTLGFKPYVYEQQPCLYSTKIQGNKVVYYVGFQPTMDIPTKILRKRIERLAPQRRASIVEVKFEPNGEKGRCIEVSSDDGLYLVGRCLTPTHNSEIASKNFPAWILGHRPEFEIIASSYNVSLPMGFSRKVKDTIDMPMYKQIFPHTRLSKTSQAAEAWLTSKGGGYVAAGVGGGITGKGAHVFIIDDPVKDSEEADSETMREKTWDWWGSTAKTRLAPGGGVLVIQCMTGDTGVLRPDGSETPLKDIRVGDEIATYDNGVLATSRVLNWANQGEDDVIAITMSSGIIVKANKRHPFLVELDGVRSWVRVRSLKLGMKIVTLRDSGVSGKERHVAKRAAKKRSAVGVCVPRTTTKLNGPQDTDHHLLHQLGSEKPTLSIDMALLPKHTSYFSPNKMERAPYVGSQKTRSMPLNIGHNGSVSTTATKLTRFVGCSAMTATSYLNGGTLQKYSNQPYDTEDFTTQTIVDISEVEREAVYDIEVETTHNFIANVLVSSNTRWHDDDLSGRMIAQMKEQKEEIQGLLDEAQERKADASTSEELTGIQSEIENYTLEMDSIDDWEVVSYPAIATDDEYVDLKTLKIVAGAEIEKVTDQYRQLRVKGDPLHEERFPKARLINMKRSMQPRHWSALYQQNPVPDEGVYFTKSMFRYEPYIAVGRKYNIYIAWDLAIGEKQTNDFTVGAVIGVDEHDQIRVLDIIRGKWDALGIVENIIDAAEKYKPQIVGIEKGALEVAIRPLLIRRMKERKAYFTLAEGKTALVPITDKIVRARPLQGRMQQGTVIFPANQAWVEQAVFELLRFPGGVHDDIVDALSWVVRLSMNFSPPRGKILAPLASWRDKLKGFTIGGSKDPMGV